MLDLFSHFNHKSIILYWAIKNKSVQRRIRKPVTQFSTSHKSNHHLVWNISDFVVDLFRHQFVDGLHITRKFKKWDTIQQGSPIFVVFMNRIYIFFKIHMILFLILASSNKHNWLWGHRKKERTNHELWNTCTQLDVMPHIWNGTFATSFLIVEGVDNHYYSCFCFLLMICILTLLWMTFLFAC